MAMNFWISIPINEFFKNAEDLMEKDEVIAVIELMGNDEDTPKSKYVRYKTGMHTEIQTLFNDSNYYGFYFTSYSFTSHDDTFKFDGSFYDDEISPYTIEGRGGVSTDKSCEQIQLRQVLKESDKKIMQFYSSLQRKLKSIENLNVTKKGLVNLYYKKSDKIIIPSNPHSIKITGSWEDYYFKNILNR